MNAVLSALKNLWGNHRKKMLAFLLSLLFAAIAALTGIPLPEIKEAAQEASKPQVIEPIGPEPAPQAPAK